MPTIKGVAQLDSTTGQVIAAQLPNLSTTGSVGILAKVAGVNLKSTGQTTLYTVPGGKTLFVTDIILVTATADTITVPPIVRVGKASSYNEWAPLATLVGLTAINTFYSLSTFSAAVVRQTFAAAEVLKIDVQTGATATLLTADVYVLGFIL